MQNSILTKLTMMLTAVFGQFNWRPPLWVKNPVVKRRAFLSILGLLVVCILAFVGFEWYQKLPKPTYISAQISEPAVTPLAEELIPEPLTINFGIKKEDQFDAKSVAPIENVEREVTEGVSISPNISGSWYWEEDSKLNFTPTADWPAGQTYTIRFDKNFFAPHVNMATMQYSFTTEPLKVEVTEFKFYQDPTNPLKKEAVATLSFNYPIDPESLKNKIFIQLQTIKNTFKHSFQYEITFDKFKRTAYLHSENITLPDEERYMELLLYKGIAAANGPSKTTENIKREILIPDAGSYFKIDNVTSRIVRNERDQPRQVLTIESTIGAKESDIQKNLLVYLLPKDYPATSTDAAKENYRWQNPGEVDANILALSTKIPLKTIPSEGDYATLHSYEFAAPSDQYLYVKITKGIQGFGDYVLNNDYSAVIPVPPFPREITFLHKGALLALTGEKKLSLIIRGLPAVKFSIARVRAEDINHLVTQTSGQFSNPYFLNENFNKQNISEIFSEIRSFNTETPDQEQYTALDIEKYLSSEKGSLGLFLLEATGWDTKKNTPLNAKTERLILVTDLGILAKHNQDGTQDIFVQSITKGDPVASASVKVLGKNGLPIATGVTTQDGHVRFPDFSDFTEDKLPTVYLVTKGNDIAFMPFNDPDRELNYSRFDIGGIQSTDAEKTALSAFLFTDRGIYRPGDTAHVAMIVKEMYSKNGAPGVPLELIITDPRGVNILDQKLKLDQLGFLSTDFNTNNTSPTGLYTANLFIVKDNHPSNLLGETTFKVSEFLPDRMRIKAAFSEMEMAGWTSPTGLMGKVNLMNLYGTPAVDRKISGKILLTPKIIQFKQYPHYTFFDPLFDPKKPPKVFTETLTDAKTDAEGLATLDFKLDRFDKATYQLTFFAEGFEAEGGRSVTTQVSTIVSSLPYFVGYKSDGDLTFIKQNGERQVNFIAVDPALKQISLKNLKVELLEERPITTLVKKPDQTYEYQSIMQTSEISTNTFDIKDSGSEYTIPTDKLGNFLIVIRDETNSELSRFHYRVVGSSQQSLPKDAEMTVKLNKSNYQSGQNIDMEIAAPYTGAGLISIESNTVNAYQWFKTATTNSLQTIHIPADLQGGGYVNIAFVRDWNSPDIVMSPLSFNIQPFSLNHAASSINITLNAPTLARPGESLHLQYQSDKPGKIIVFAVDEGILQVAKYATPDPLGFFFQKRALQVQTQQILDQILPKFIADRELSAVGGDAGDEELSQYLNPFKRKTDLPVVYWSAILDTDQTPHELTFSVPDYFNGALRIMAVAVSDNAVGSKDVATEVRGDFVINPNVPTEVAPNDEFEITASIANNIDNSGKNAPVQVEISASPGLELLSSNKQTINISAGSENTIRVKARAKPILGSAELTFRASLQDKKSQITSTLSIRPATPYQTTLISGHATKSATVKLQRDLYAEKEETIAMLSTNPLIFVFGLERYLNNYPYGCTEQLVSKAFPLLIMMGEPRFVDDVKVMTEKINATIQMLNQRQLSSGGFSYWPDVSNNANNNFASVYAMHFLTENRSKGFYVSREMFNNGLTFLKNLSSQNVDSLEEARIQAYAIYVLTRNEIITTNYLTHLQLYLENHPELKWHQDITNVFMAATYQLLKSDKAANQLLDAYKPDGQTTERSDFYNDDVASAEYLYLIARHFPDRLPKIGDKLVMSLVDHMNTDWINTISSSFMSLALSSYASAYQMQEQANFNISETMKDGKEKTLTHDNNNFQQTSIDPGVTTVHFNNAGKIPYFYQLLQSGFDVKPATSVIKQGLEVFREYRDVNNKVIHQVSLGDEVEVHIQLRALKNDYESNIVILDLLPGGFEVVQNSIKNNNTDYIDAREDRVLFFGGATSNTKEIVYRIKATNIGDYLVPPIYATSMYNPNVQAAGVSEQISVIK